MSAVPNRSNVITSMRNLIGVEHLLPDVLVITPQATRLSNEPYPQILSGQIADAVRAAKTEGTPLRVIINLEHAEYMDSRTHGGFINLQKQLAHGQDHPLQFAGMQPDVYASFTADKKLSERGFANFVENDPRRSVTEVLAALALDETAVHAVVCNANQPEVELQ